MKMTVNSLPALPAAEQSPPPCNIEAEQALLGAILSNNDTFAPVSEIVGPEHFFDPVHQDIFRLISERIARNALAVPTTLKIFADRIPGLDGIGGTDYLFRLANAAIAIHLSRDIAREIADLFRRRQLIELGREMADRAARPEADSPLEDLMDDAEARLYRLNQSGGPTGGFQSFARSAADAVRLALAAQKRKSGTAGLSTGFAALDLLTGGLHPTDLTVVAGRPSMGKTALACNIAFNVARNWRREGVKGDPGSADGGHVGFFSLEMSAEQLAGRILSEISRVPSHRIRSGRIADGDFVKYIRAAKEVQSAPLYIDDTPALTIAQLAVRARRLKETQGLDLLVVDYLQLVRPSLRHENRVNAVSEVSQGLKAVAKELSIPVLAVAQLSRSVENRDGKRPELADLRESGAIEQDADAVLFVYREAYYQSRQRPPDSDPARQREWLELMEAIGRSAQIIIGKQRNGPVGTVELEFEEEFTRFHNPGEAPPMPPLRLPPAGEAEAEESEESEEDGDAEGAEPPPAAADSPEDMENAF